MCQPPHNTDDQSHATPESALVERIHASGCRCVVSVTGGGSRAVAALLTVPGASASVLEVAVPYAPTALASWLGGEVDQACSEQTARAMAMASFERARRLSSDDARQLRGIGATASLATSRPKRGEHRLHVAWQSADTTVVYSCELAKGSRTRGQEEVVAARFVLGVVAEACGVADSSLTAPTSDELIVRREHRASAAWTELLLGEREWLLMHEALAEPVALDRPAATLVFPGSFNPLHSGHRQMAKLAAERLQAATTLELSITNVDKPALDFLEIDDRTKPLADYPVLLTRATTFAKKAALVPGATFVIGADTLERLVDVQYYGASAERRDEALSAIADHGCRFLVYGRLVDGQFRTLEDVANLPAELRRLCEAVPESEFREDISSTSLRASD